MNKLLYLLPFMAILMACQKETEEVSYRPQHHFTPPQNWTNDPNGMVYLDGEYHLFYQHNPFGDKWGHMSWGHAVSEDLMNWEHLPIAIPEFDNGDGSTSMIFSGSAVIDSANTSGFFDEGFTKGMVAIFTVHVDSSGQGRGQYQSIAYSTDKGRTWTHYEKNPVLDLGMRDFRDPNVIWNEQRESWLMSVVKPQEYLVQFYESNDLKEWSLLSEFGKQGDTTKIWECPSLFEVPIEGSDETKWALLISSGHKTPGYIGMQYFIGDFDGKTFSPQTQSEVLQVDAGKDFYAAIPFNSLPKTHEKPIIMGWTTNWAYANDTPTSGFRGGFSFPREVWVKNINGSYTLMSKPIVSEQIETVILSKETSKASFDEPVFHVQLSDLQTPFKLKLQQSDEVYTSIIVENGVLKFDRTKSGKVDFNSSFPSIDTMEIGEFENLDLYMDESVIELFVNNGAHVMTQQIFPTQREVEVILE
ncbi:GH32 C-terminal domain-containing protein [Jiulongibacter sp. NS-SX5]|uniref:GH32 C-terminal domain-containing protein n=1 Tax=Jiulongibacter sp. NS-SX5 TaxID=3463854 RepID=UPI0040593DDD